MILIGNDYVATQIGNGTLPCLDIPLKSSIKFKNLFIAFHEGWCYISMQSIHLAVCTAQHAQHSILSDKGHVKHETASIIYTTSKAIIEGHEGHIGRIPLKVNRGETKSILN